MSTPVRGSEPGRGIRAFDTALTVAWVGLMAATVLFAVVSSGVLGGHGSATLQAQLQGPYTVALPDGRAWTVASYGDVSASGGLPTADEGPDMLTAPTVRTELRVQRDDVDTRVVTVATIGAYLALAWFGWVCLRRVVRSSKTGDPFHPRNAVRLRWLAGAVVGTEVVGRVGGTVASRTLDSDLPVEITLSSAGLTLSVGVALALLALSEVFRTGSSLRQLDLETV